MSITIEGEWFTKYIEKEIGQIYDCYIAEIIEEFGAVKLLGSEV